MRPTSLAVLVASGFVIIGCGGRGGGDSSAPASTPQATNIPQGLYKGTTSNGRLITGLVLDDGTYYVLYSSDSIKSLIAGVVQGTGTALDGSFSSINGKDINLEGAGVLSANVSASFVLSSTLNGSLTYPSLNQTLTFTSTYDQKYELVPSLATIAGTYSGWVGSPVGVEDATIIVSTSGAVTGHGSSGCNFSGTVAPRSKGNAYNAIITFASSPCLFPNTAVTGGAYFDAATKRLYAVGLKTARDTGFIFSGVKP
jgi:hypothetical protein